MKTFQKGIDHTQPALGTLGDSTSCMTHQSTGDLIPLMTVASRAHSRWLQCPPGPTLSSKSDRAMDLWLFVLCQKLYFSLLPYQFYSLCLY